MTATVVVPLSTDDPDRFAAWWWVQARWQAAGYQTVTGTCEGTWCKAKAVADAIAKTDADTLIISDADVWVSDLSVVEQVADGTFEWAVPHRRVYRLNEQATKLVLAGADVHETASTRGMLAQASYDGMVGGGILVIRRDLYERVPLDPRFVGWGGEDECLPAGTLISTRRGSVPIEHVEIGDEVATREGWRKVLKSGATGQTDGLIALRHPLGFVLCTGNHPVLVDGQFVPAMNVKPGQNLLVNSKAASMANRSRGVGAGGMFGKTATTAMEVPTAELISAAFCTERYGKPIEGRFPTDSLSITSTRIAKTTDSRIFNSWSLDRTRRTTGLDSCGGPTRNAAFTQSRTGRTALLDPSPAPTVEKSSYPRELDRLSTVPVVAVNVLPVTLRSVYNLTVDRTPEFFADGVLVHNSWGRALKTLAPRRTQGAARLWHLFHKPQERMNRRMGSVENRKLTERYIAAAGEPDAMRALIEEARCHSTASASAT